MPREIERRFLVHADRLPELGGGCRLVQGYLCAQPQIRFRIQDGQVTLAIKQWISPGQRVEIEFPRDDMRPEDIEALVRMALWPPLVKTRHRITHGGLVWEMDVYAERNLGLITAEVELPEIAHPIDFPPWVDSSAEITEDARYANIALTRHPYAEWGQS